MEYLDNIGKRAQAAKPDLQHLKSEEKNQILRKSADELRSWLPMKRIWKKAGQMACPRDFWTGFY